MSIISPIEFVTPGVRSALHNLEELLLPAGGIGTAPYNMDKAYFQRLRETGVFSLTMPNEFGGADVEWHTLMDVVRHIARSSGSVAWIVGLACAHNTLVRQLSRETQEEVFSAGKMIVGSASGAVETVAVRNGENLIVNGSWRYASFSAYADWIFVGVEQDGATDLWTKVLLPSCEICTILPRKTIGVRGAQTNQIVVRDCCVPPRRTLTGLTDEPLMIRRPGGFDLVPYSAFIGSIALAPVIGLVEKILDVFIEAVRARTCPRTGLPLRRIDSVLESVALLSAKCEAAVRAFNEIKHLLSDPLHREFVATSAGQQRLKRDRVYAAELCYEIGETAIRRLGTSGVVESEEICVYWQDLQTLCSHVDLNIPGNMQLSGNLIVNQFEAANAFRIGAIQQLEWSE